ncbi:sodium:solute symporter family protein [Blastopirellula sp. J2-11]|uniref:sodium:solute symporter family protein n=1 Tax=Blastopirellula sp. J2-11 TaxID=2943192 RepID=UPI0021C5ACEB|nr:sodium:solute symporter family protein [Blastopirellula sp. J2-11]UUO07726.1 sodium:solute symporter family protein [Blastopirellula sp. J2-11]
MNEATTNPTAASDLIGSIPFVVLVVYLLVLLAIGWIGYRQSKQGEEDYYLAGRGQSWLISSLTIMATFFSSFALLGAPGMVYREGVVFALVSLNVPIAGFCVYLLGSRIWQAGRAHGYVTQADMLCDHYDSHLLLRVLITLVGFLFAIPYIIMQLKAGGELAAVLFVDYDYAFEVGTIVLAAITALYIMIGGMRSVAWTDALQCILLILGMLLAGVAMVASLGGLSGFRDAVAELPESSLTVPGNSGFWQLPMLFTICLLMPIGGIIQPAQWMRFYAARDQAALKKSALIFILLLTGCFMFGIMLVGLGSQALYPLQISADGVSPAPEIASYDQVLVVVLRDHLPKLLGPSLGTALASLTIVAIMAAAMSTADSNLHALSALVTRDIYDRFIRPQASEGERVWVGRFVILAATLGSLALVLMGSRPESSLAEFMGMIVDLALFAVAFSVQLLPMTIDVLFLRRGTALAATSGLIAGITTAFLFTPLFPTVAAWVDLAPLDSLVTHVQTAAIYLPIHASAWGLAVNVMLFLLILALTKRTPQPLQLRAD